MLNSDSDFEYPDTGLNSEDESSSEGALMGKRALGVDPSEMRSYDGRSTPQNGSQYLLKVMAEKRRVPKVAYADPRKLPVVLVTRSSVSEKKDPESINPNYLERFMQMCSAYEEERGKLLGEVNMKLLPSLKWREETISGFSETRTKIDRWRYKIEAAEIFLNTSVKLPPNNDNVHWLKFCFGQSFVQLSSCRKSRTAEEKLEDFFLDLYDPSTSIKLEDIAITAAGGDGKDAAAAPETPKGSESNSAKVCGGGGDADSAKEELILDTKCPPEVEKTNPDAGTGPNLPDNDKDKVDAGMTGTGTADNVNNEVVLEKESESDSESDSDEPGTPLNVKSPAESTKCVPHAIGHRPLMNVVLRLNQTQLENLVKWNLLWLKNIGFVNECQGQWLYAILACLGKPIEPTIMSDLRNMARILISVRNSISEFDELQENNETPDLGESTEGGKDVKIFDFINTLNLFIYIIADYFQQKDLIMHL